MVTDGKDINSPGLGVHTHSATRLFPKLFWWRTSDVPFLCLEKVDMKVSGWLWQVGNNVLDWRSLVSNRISAKKESLWNIFILLIFLPYVPSDCPAWCLTFYVWLGTTWRISPLQALRGVRKGRHIYPTTDLLLLLLRLLPQIQATAKKKNPQ